VSVISLELNNSVKRDRLAMFAGLLEAISRYPHLVFSRQSAAANINHVVAKGLMAVLVARGYAKLSPKGGHKRYHITNEGLSLINKINACYCAVSELNHTRQKVEVATFER